MTYLYFLVNLTACVSRDISDLEDQVANIMARPGDQIESLPEIRPYQAYTYQSGVQQKRNPFKTFYLVSKPEQSYQSMVDDNLSKAMEQEISNRNREELEQFELDSLRMVGTMNNENTNWGIISDPDGVIHSVKVGNYLGVNIGKITDILEDRINVREIVQDSAGRWQERQTTLTLIEQ